MCARVGGDQLCPCQEPCRIEHAALLEERDSDAQNLPRQDAENGVVMESPVFVSFVYTSHQSLGERSESGKEQGFTQSRRTSF